jgi:2-polyprenyl-3-methyl-5-hydroxy-6-metoxy-1,4-benzoquinol methylase
MKREHVSGDYDRMFIEGGHEGVYGLPYRHSCYFPLFRAVRRELAKRGARRLLEVGCGTGAFAHYILKESSMGYAGFDFSPAAVEMAVRRTERGELFRVGDAREPSSYDRPHDAIVCTEVLEHIDADRRVVSQWAPGTVCVCSVPNFDADNHVRFFPGEAEIRTRYGDLIAVEFIRQVRKPELTNISLASYVRAVRWNRYSPRRLAQILGLTSFDKGGGWFVFAGRRTDVRECGSDGDDAVVPNNRKSAQ